jgi:hypothetical protein
MHSVEINFIHAEVHDAPASAKHPMGDQCSALDELDTGNDDGCAEQGDGGCSKGTGSAEFSVPAEETPNTFVGRVGVAEVPEPVINVEQSSQLDEMALFTLLRRAQDLLPERPIPSERRADMQAMISRLPRLTSTDEPHDPQQNYARTRPKTLDEFLMGARLRGVHGTRREGPVKPQSEY